MPRVSRLFKNSFITVGEDAAVPFMRMRSMSRSTGSGWAGELRNPNGTAVRGQLVEPQRLHKGLFQQPARPGRRPRSEREPTRAWGSPKARVTPNPFYF